MVLLHLSLIQHVGPGTVLKIISRLPHITNLKDLYSYTQGDFVRYFGVSPRIGTILEQGLNNKKILDEELELITKYNITILSLFEKDYPQLLKQIYHPPLVLYCKGSPLNENQKRLAIVGSRKADHYAKTCVKTIVPELVKDNWEIVSGGAEGVDSMAHSETLQNYGKTIAVFGSGLMQPYPLHNKELFRTIVRGGGTLISPFSLKMSPCKGNFPARNRIIAGLSHGCVVVRASQKSGALITAQFALDQGKQVFAFPGPIDHELSAGCHKLLQDGAKLVTGPNDIFEEFRSL